MGAEGIILAKSLNSNLLRACAIEHCKRFWDIHHIEVVSLMLGYHMRLQISLGKEPIFTNAAFEFPCSHSMNGFVFAQTLECCIGLITQFTFVILHQHLLW